VPQASSGPGKHRARAYSLRTLLVGYGLAVAVPLIVLLGIVLGRSALLERAQVEARMGQLVQYLADDIDREIDRRIAILQTLATSPALATGNLASFHAQARAAVGQSDAGIFLIEPGSLQQLVNTYTAYGASLPTYGSPETAKRIIQTRAPQVSGYFIGRVSRRPVFDIVIPIGDESIRYLLVLGLSPNDLVPMLKGLQSGPGWATSIWDRDDVVLARSPDHEKYVGKKLPKAILQSPSMRGGVSRTLNLDGEPVLQAVSTVRFSGWRVSVNVPLHAVEQPLRMSLLLWGGAGLAAALLAALLAVPFGRALTRPMQFASQAAAALGKGEQVGILQSGLREANKVVDAMRAASHQLHDRDERQRLLLAEFSHRVKNILSVVISVVHQTLSAKATNLDHRETLTRRLHALSRTHDLLIASSWNGALLNEVVAPELAPYGARATMDGPRVLIGTSIAQTFALVLHELATNASKYGALSGGEGQVFVKWWIAGDGPGARFHFLWQETGGPPVTSPDRTGFGSALLRSAFPATGETKPSLSFEPDGVLFAFDTLLTAIEHDSSRQ
jgi:two-component sensor histidine kinase